MSKRRNRNQLAARQRQREKEKGDYVDVILASRHFQKFCRGLSATIRFNGRFALAVIGGASFAQVVLPWTNSIVDHVWPFLPVGVLCFLGVRLWR